MSIPVLYDSDRGSQKRARHDQRLAPVFSNPWSMFDAIDDHFDQIFNNVFGSPSRRSLVSLHDSLKDRSLYPKVDVSRKDGKLRIDCAVPGLVKDDLKVEIKENVLTIRGEKQEVEENDAYECRELRRSAFSRSWQLGENVKAETLQAELKNGILSITMDCVNVVEATPETKQIEIKS